MGKIKENINALKMERMTGWDGFILLLLSMAYASWINPHFALRILGFIIFTICAITIIYDIKR